MGLIPSMEDCIDQTDMLGYCSIGEREAVCKSYKYIAGHINYVLRKNSNMFSVILFNEVLDCTHDVEIALTVVQMHLLNVTKRLKARHITTNGLFTKELIARFKQEFGSFLDTIKLEKAISIWMAEHTWDIHRSMGGLGGTDPKKRITDFAKPFKLDED
jgi:hypothetical protein